MVMDLHSYSSWLVDTFTAVFPMPIKVQEMPGRFDVSLLDKYSLQAPCLLVSVLGGDDTQQSEGEYKTQASVYVLTKSGRASSPYQQGLALISRVIAAIDGGKLNSHADVSSPTDVRWGNLFGAEAGNDAVWLGQVTFRQVLDQSAAAIDPTLADWLTLFAEIGSPSDPYTTYTQDSINVRTA